MQLGFVGLGAMGLPMTRHLLEAGHHVTVASRSPGPIEQAVALGADAVILGRAALYGLAAGGEPGVRRALEILTSEIDRALGQLGCNRMNELSPAMLRRRNG